LALMQDRRLAGIGYMTLGIAAFSAMDAIGKWLVRDYSVYQILALRSTFAAFLLTAMIPFLGGREALRSTQRLAHIGRSWCSLLAFLFFFTSVRYLPLADAVAVAFGGPFIVTALSVPLLGEQVDGRRWLAIGVGFVGMLLIVQPTGAGFRPAALLVIASSFAYAFLMIMSRWMARRSDGKEKTFTFLYYTFVLQATFGWLVVIIVLGGWRPMTPGELGLGAGMGTLALTGHFGITRAFQLAPVSLVAPFEYTALVWATMLGFIVFRDFPGADVWIGVAVIIVAGLYTIHRER
jgi:drug/metabolite transporter (DMT)-like permease